jgi:anti-sigma regulatory factor (Ser/Thr protein kinase)/anti-anti-sigma regulatory factor
MTELRTAIVRNLDTDVTTVRANGVLDLRTAAEMRAVLLKVISECPSAVVIDVSDCAVAHPAALAVFAAAMRHHAWQPVVAVSLGGADPSFFAHGGRAALGNVPVYASTRSAAEAAAETRTRQQRELVSLPPEPEAPGLARVVIGEACRRWGLPQLETPAALVVSELVTNAIVHGCGRVLMEATLRESFVHIRVHDGSTREPLLGPPLDHADPHRDNGRGLRLVERQCSAWGFLPRADGGGKVVWATLRARPIAAV